MLCAGVDRHRMSAPRVPSESNAGGLYKNVFLQIAHRTNIQKLPYCLASRLSIIALDPWVPVEVITETKSCISLQKDALLFYVHLPSESSINQKEGRGMLIPNSQVCKNGLHTQLLYIKFQINTYKQKKESIEKTVKPQTSLKNTHFYNCD